MPESRWGQPQVPVFRVVVLVWAGEGPGGEPRYWSPSALRIMMRISLFLIRLAPPPVPGGTVPRADVAAVIAALLDNPGTRHQTLELVGGDIPVAAAVHSIS